MSINRWDRWHWVHRCSRKCATIGSGSAGGVRLSSTERAGSVVVISVGIVMGAIVWDGCGVKVLFVGREKRYVARIIDSF